MIEYRQQYKSGDLIMSYSFPFEERDGAKPRPAIVLGDYGRTVSVIPVMGIYTHKNKTEKEVYRLSPDEVRVPRGIPFINGKTLSGVIKTDRIEQLSKEEVSGALAEFPLRTKIEILTTYEDVKEHGKLLNPQYDFVMKKFKENVIAEKLNFLTNKKGNHFEYLRDEKMRIDRLQRIDKFGTLDIYSVELTDDDRTFTYNIATNKKGKKLLHDWGKSKTALEWLKEDAKYHALMKNIDQEMRLDPTPHPDKYQKYHVFRRKEFQQLKGGLER